MRRSVTERGPGDVDGADQIDLWWREVCLKENLEEKGGVFGGIWIVNGKHKIRASVRKEPSRRRKMLSEKGSQHLRGLWVDSEEGRHHNSSW